VRVDPRLQRRVQRYGWDKAAARYERYWSQQLAPAQELLLHLAALRAGERVVDVACGTGLVSLAAARAVGVTGEVVGTDLSDRMVEEAAARSAQGGLTQVRFARMDAESLQLPDCSFDAALCALGLMYCPDPRQACREMCRVLRAGGRVVAAVWGARRNCGWAEVFPIVQARVRSEVCPLFFQLGTGDSLRLTLSEAGFEDIRVERIDTTLRYDSAADALGAAFAGGPVALAYSRFDQADREGAHREYLASIDSFRAGAGYRIPGEFVVASGVKGGGGGQ
jgi:ubiquinone/menaquinone biosynthesis C-methylase UbiE